MLSSNKSRSGLITLGLLSSLLLIISICVGWSPKVSAAASVYPYDLNEHFAISSASGDWGPNNGSLYNCKKSQYPPGVNGHPDQDASACATGLDAQTTRYKLFVDNTGSMPGTTVFLQDGCKNNNDTDLYDKPNKPDKGARKIRVEIRQTEQDGSIGPQQGASVYNDNAGSCVGNDLRVPVSGNAFTTHQSGRYTDKVLTALVVVYKNGGLPGNKLFKVAYGSGQVFGDDDGRFALADNQEEVGPNGDVSKYTFTFTPDCRFRGNEVDFVVGDMDWNRANSFGELPFVSLKVPGQPEITQPRPGNQGDVKFTLRNSDGSPFPFQQGVPYTVTVYDVGNDNGLRFGLPFSEYPTTHDCPPSPNPVGQCNTLTVHDTSFYSSPRYGNVRSRTRVNITSPPGPAIVGNETIGYHATHPPNAYTWNYSPGGPKVIITIHREMAVGNRWLPEDGNGGADATQGTGTYTCYQATCSLSVTGDGPGGIVVAGGTAHVTGTINNPPDPNNPYLQNLPRNLPSGPYLSVSESNGTGHPVNQVVPLGQSRSVNYDVGAAGSVSNQTVSAYPDYWGYGNFGPYGGYQCSATFPVYGPFTLLPTAQVKLSPSKENPNLAINTAYVTATGAPVKQSVSSSIYIKPIAGGNISKGSTSSNGPFPVGNTCFFQSPPPDSVAGCPATYNGTYAIASPQAGDRYCAEVDVQYTSGYVGPGGDVAGGVPGTPAISCPVVTNEPYFAAYNSGVLAAPVGSSVNSCSGSGVLAGWNDNTGSPRGAGAQLSALALIRITGFASALTTPVLPPSGIAGAGLTFANTGVGVAVGQDGDSPPLGGSFGSVPCVTVASPPDDAKSEAGNTADLSSLPDGAHIYANSDGTPRNVTLHGGQIGVGSNKAVYVSGNVYIDSPITYVGTGGGWTVTGATPSVPSFTLVVTGGNIYVKNDVAELSGNYQAAQNKSGHCNNGLATCGTIFTCSDDPAAPFKAAGPTAMYGSCNTQLTVYGSFVANKVDLMRTFGSLRNGVSGEKPNGAAHACVSSAGSFNQAVCAAEVFRFSPELYLSTPATRPPSNGAGQWDAVASLPPVL